MLKEIIFDRFKHKVGIIAPASGPKDEAENKLREAVFFLERYGFKVKYNRNILSGSDLPYFAADRETRLGSLKEMLLDPEILIIWGFRGGYGSGEIIFDCLDLPITTPKILIGFSDLTSVHFLFTQHYNLPGIHGPVLTSLIDKQQAMIDETLAVLSGKETKINLNKISSSILEPKEINGLIMGGNLTLICNMIGTKLSPQFQDKIIFLEDINDKGYRIHRNLLHMKNADLFNGVKAIIFGDFSPGDDIIDHSITSFCQNHIPNIPSFRAEGIGHENVNLPIVLGAKGKIMNNLFTFSGPFKLL